MKIAVNHESVSYGDNLMRRFFCIHGDKMANVANMRMIF